MNTDGLSKLKSLIVHYSPEDYAKYGAGCTEFKLPTNAKGRTLLDVYPTSDIQAVELRGDEVDFPSALASSLVSTAKIVANDNSAAGQTADFRIKFKSGKIISVYRFFNSLDGSPMFTTDDGCILVLPSVLQSRYPKNLIAKGMTRADVEKHFGIDGGITSAFRYERFIFLEKEPTKDGLVTKINVRFKPAHMTDALFYLGKWQIPKISKEDTVMAVSQPYLEQEFRD